MTRILIFIGHYLPATRAGGPVRSVTSMVESLKNEEFSIFTSETDFKSSKVLDGITMDSWQQKDSTLLFYASSRNRGLRGLRRTLIETTPDLVYLNSFFARRFTFPILVLRKLHLVPRYPTIVAPRGEFSRGALAIKPVRKRVYLSLARWLGLYQGIVWHACSTMEMENIRRIQGPHARIILAPNFPPAPHPDALTQHLPKQQNLCRLVFLSRISPKKNLIGALQALSLISGRVEFDIYGPIEDSAYWVKCQDALKALPSNVTARYCGAVDPDQVETVFSRYDALFLPTWGENYGFAIVEAWAAATPVLISDCTPWRNLESDQAGWTAAPDDHHRFASHIVTLVKMNEAEHVRWRTGALARAATLANDLSLESAYVSLFQQAFDATIP